jgi:hypothetical protein
MTRWLFFFVNQNVMGVLAWKSDPKTFFSQKSMCSNIPFVANLHTRSNEKETLSVLA